MYIEKTVSKTQKKKYVLVHSGSRDNYKLAESLFENDLLGYFVTDDYLFRFLIRKNNSIPLVTVITSYSAVLLIILHKLTKRQSYQIIKDEILSKKAAKIANKYQYDLVAYSYYGLPAFEILDKSLSRILFQLHPHPNFIRKLFREELKLNPGAERSLRQEHELQDYNDHFQRLNFEAQRADLVLCASSFTKYTLEQENVKTEIHVVPYGVNMEDFPYCEREVKVDSFFNVLFVGSLNQRKGVTYLLEAISQLQIQGNKIQLTIVGRGIFDKKLLDQFAIDRLTVRQNVTNAELLFYYKEADVFVLPSICEGFGQVLLEAMATGLPVISTFHTSAPDLITDGVDGFVIPIRDSKAIMESILFLVNNPSERIQMGIMAHEKSKIFTWEMFKNNLIKRLNV